MTELASGQPETGTVAMFNARRGFGFISPNDAGAGAVFVCRDVLRETGIDGLMPGQRVKFIRRRSRRGWSAARVRLLVKAA